ncbi:MAG: radical SAM protein [Acidobacteria bacterium]|nr:MAG: radical SAM protein [Acidobacteriota bacterium]
MSKHLKYNDPGYLGLLSSGELTERVKALEALLERCTVCPRDCLNNRLRNEIAACYSGRLPIVSSYTPHFGEEPPLVGTRGAGNIFFGNCNLRCVYCQNYQISQTHKEQIKNEVTHERLAEMMLELQARGCHNINFVSPTHFAPQMARGILIAAEQGLRLPRECSRAAISEMHRQTGDELIYGEDGLLKRGLVIRLLVLPNDLGGVRDSLEWIRNELGPRVAVSLMAQYYPTNVAGTNQRYALLSRRIRETEWLRAVAALDELEIQEGWMQEYDGAAFYYRPDFTDGQTPFRDVRDFQS